MSIIPDPGPNPNPVPTPELSPHDLNASRLLGDVQTLVKAIRGYGFITNNHKKVVNSMSMVPTEFLLAVAVALDASEKLRQVAEITGDQIRDIVSFCNAYGPAATEMKLKGEGVLQAVKTQRFDIGQVCLRIYRVARNSNLPSDRGLLYPHIQSMKQALARGRKKRAIEAPAPAPDPNAPAKGVGNA